MENYVSTPTLSFVQAIKNCFSKYCCFTGRARRSEYWWFAVLNYIWSGLVYYAVNYKLTVKADLESQVMEAVFDQEKMNALTAQAEAADSTFMMLMIVCGIVGLVLLLPGLGVACRRLHDIGKSGWWLLLALVPLVNCIFAIVILIWTIKDGAKETNQYGPSPKYILTEA
ncbi:MAG: DUF805 domain-containing protein [Prevotella sp.]|nr:DUF805 domain-containing protein [Prevotella sp.]MBR6191323.1 DUF805 domain-containing protein [Prevotella sp.]